MSSQLNSKPIPKTLHYIFGMAPDFGGKPWGLIHYVCLKSAIERIKPEHVFFYYEFEPSGPWWDLSRPLVELVKIEAPKEIFGRPLKHVSHRAGVVRLQKLIEHGGIYLDADVYVHKSFDDLLGNSTVLGQEGENAEWGTADAVILAEKNSPFLTRWLSEYRTFRSAGRDEYWAEHAVQVPARLAREYPQDIKLLSHKAFFWPLWTSDHLKWIFASTDPISLEDTYANHLWEAQAWKYIEGLTPGRIRREDSNFNFWARPWLADLPDHYGRASAFKRLKRRLRPAVNTVRRAIHRIGGG